MKHLLNSAVLLTLAVTTALPAASQPAASPSSPTSQEEQFLNDPVLRGVKLTSKQKAKLLSIRKDSNKRAQQILTPEQKKIVATKGAGTLNLSESQKQKYLVILNENRAKSKAVFTPEQLKQIDANIRQLQGGNGKNPVPSTGKK